MIFLYRWFSYISHCKTSMYRAFPIATFDLLDGNEMTHSLISWIWGRTSMASIASVMVYAMPWLQRTTGGWLTWRNLISPNFTELYNHPNKTYCPPTSSASLGLPIYPYLPNIYIYIFIYIWSLLLLIQPPCLSEPKTSERPRLALRFAFGLGFGHGLLRHLGLCAAELWVYLGEPQILWPNQCWVRGKMDKDDETSWNQGFVTTPIFNRSTKPDRHHLQQPPQPPLSPRVSASPPPGRRICAATYGRYVHAYLLSIHIDPSITIHQHLLNLLMSNYYIWLPSGPEWQWKIKHGNGKPPWITH